MKRSNPRLKAFRKLDKYTFLQSIGHRIVVLCAEVCLQTHQILADKHPDKHGEKDAADEPEDSEGIELLRFNAAVLSRLLAGQLTPKFHGVIEARQVVLEAPARGAADVVRRRPLPLQSLPESAHVILHGRRRLAAVRQRRAPPLWSGGVRQAAERRRFWQEGRRPLRRRGRGPRLRPVEVKMETRLCRTPGSS